MGVISYIKEEIKVVKERDPAIKSDIEVLLYPSFKVMLHYRIAHKLTDIIQYRIWQMDLIQVSTRNFLVSAGAKVIGSFKIGKNSKIGAGSVVIEEVPPNCTVVGVPGRIVRMGDQKVPSADLDQIHQPDPVLNDIRQLQTDNIRLKKELKALKEKLAKEKIIEEA